MLSRLALRAVQDTKPCLAVLIRSSSSAVTKDASGSDQVTFERPKQRVHPGKVRMGFIPEEWFQFFYPKTGVTGPYVFGASFLTYLFSKEILVMEHEFFTGVSLAALIIFGIKKFGPKLAISLDQEIEETLNSMNGLRDGSIKDIKENIEHEKHIQWEMQGQSMLFDAKKENIALQLEAAFRERLVNVHSQVKKKLDYQLETANVITRLEQKHMVNWIVDNVRKSITPAQESAVLKQCIGDLKGLSAKA